MKAQILKIADKLRENQISTDEAQSLLLGLLFVLLFGIMMENTVIIYQKMLKQVLL